VPRGLRTSEDVKKRIDGRVEFSCEVETLEFGNGFKKGVLDAAFVHQESFDDSCIREVFNDGAAECERGVRGLSVWLRKVSHFEGEGVSEFCQGIRGRGFEQHIEGLVLDGDSAFESPGEVYNAVGEHRFHRADGV